MLGYRLSISIAARGFFERMLQKPNGVVAGNVGPIDPANIDVGTESWLRDCAGDSSQLRRTIAGGRGFVVSGAPTIAKAEMGISGLESLGKQTGRKGVHADGGRQATTDAGTHALGTDYRGRCRRSKSGGKERELAHEVLAQA